MASSVSKKRLLWLTLLLLLLTIESALLIPIKAHIGANNVSKYQQTNHLVDWGQMKSLLVISSWMLLKSIFAIFSVAGMYFLGIQSVALYRRYAVRGTTTVSSEIQKNIPLVPVDDSLVPTNMFYLFILLFAILFLVIAIEVVLYLQNRNRRPTTDSSIVAWRKRKWTKSMKSRSNSIGLNRKRTKTARMKTKLKKEAQRSDECSSQHTPGSRSSNKIDSVDPKQV